jgi:acetoacetyl-CoA synthetase
MTPTDLWTPPDELSAARDDGAVHARARLLDLRRAAALVGRGPRGVLGLDLGPLRRGERGETVLASREMPGAQWFPGTRSTTPSTRSAAAGRRARDRSRAARTARRPSGPGASCASTARIAPGCGRWASSAATASCAYMPNIPETAAPFLACASWGAVWSSCSPDFGARSVDRPLRADRAQGSLLGGARLQYNGRQFDPLVALRRDRRFDAPACRRPCSARRAGTL